MTLLKVAVFLFTSLLILSCSSGTCKNSVTSETSKENEKIKSTQIKSTQMKSKTYNQMRKDWENQQ